MTTFAASALIKMAYSALLASVGAAAVFSLVILGVVRWGDMRRANRGGAAAAYATLAACALVASLAIVVYGLVLVAHKS
jgi:hypothetical protein